MGEAHPLRLLTSSDRCDLFQGVNFFKQFNPAQMENTAIAVMPEGRSAYWDTKDGILRSLRDRELSSSDLVRPANIQESVTIGQWIASANLPEVDPMRVTVGFKERIGWLSIVAVLLTAFAALLSFYAADRAAWGKEKVRYRNQVAELEAISKQQTENDKSVGEVTPLVADTAPQAKVPNSTASAPSINAPAPTGIQPAKYPASELSAQPVVQTPALYTPAWSPSPAAFVAENGSYRGELNSSFVPKTVYVNGYFRRDGTYVRGHYRAPPRR